MWRNLFFAFAILVSSGCSVHPLPKDYAGIPTKKITDHVQCETQNALHSILIGYLINFKPEGHSEVHRPTSEVGQHLRIRQAESITPLSKAEEKDVIARLHPEAKIRIEDFRRIAIAYRFKFELTEDNDNGGDLTLSMPFTNGTVSLVLASGAKKTRANQRVFSVANTFGETLARPECRKEPIRDPNLIYPITGKIGLQEVLQTFVSLSLDHELTKGKNDVGEFTERLTFTTKLTASAKPKLTLNAVNDQFRVTEANFSSVHERTDLHEVAVALSVPDSKDTIDRNRRTGKPTRSAKEKANGLLEQFRSRDALQDAFEQFQK